MLKIVRLRPWPTDIHTCQTNESSAHTTECQGGNLDSGTVLVDIRLVQGNIMARLF